MRISGAVFVFLVLCAAPLTAAEELIIPPEVTPQLRAACESDVRPLCIGKKPTMAKVKRCVAKKFFKLGRRCQIELTSLGFNGM